MTFVKCFEGGRRKKGWGGGQLKEKKGTCRETKGLKRNEGGGKAPAKLMNPDGEKIQEKEGKKGTLWGTGIAGKNSTLARKTHRVYPKF